ncbi:MAG: hypothetical protein ABJA33_06310 [Pedococcus sp.]
MRDHDSGSLVDRGHRVLGWLLSPATEDVPRHQAVGATVLRILLGFLWLWNVSWKRPPDFGEQSNSGLFKFTSYAVSHPVIPPYSFVVEKVVLPNLAVFGWGVLVAETVLAVLLLTGTWIRLAAVLGIAQSSAIALSVAFAPGEWPWSYLLMLGGHLSLLLSSSGRHLAVEGVRHGVARGRLLYRVFGGVAVVVGLVAAVASLGDPLAASGPAIALSSWEVGLGNYNLLGGLLLAVVGVLLLLADRLGVVAAWVAAGLAVVGALSLHAQIGFTDPLLGGGATSAALLLAMAVVAATRARDDTPISSTTSRSATSRSSTSRSAQ